jgi:hypothetical protein
VPSFAETMKEKEFRFSNWAAVCVLKIIVNTQVLYIYIFNADYHTLCIFLFRKTSANISILF